MRWEFRTLQAQSSRVSTSPTAKKQAVDPNSVVASNMVDVITKGDVTASSQLEGRPHLWGMLSVDGVLASRCVHVDASWYIGTVRLLLRRRWFLWPSSFQTTSKQFAYCTGLDTLVIMLTHMGFTLYWYLERTRLSNMPINNLNFSSSWFALLKHFPGVPFSTQVCYPRSVSTLN